jgi:hypothetical protein
MRELISPVLIGALCLVDDHNRREDKSKVRLICEKLISGISGHGPVDYVLSYLHVYIVINEAKHPTILDGLFQNLVQQCNALEYLADNILDSSLVGSKRSRDFLDTYADLRNLQTFGITSTGKEWIFFRTEKDPSDSSKVISTRSPRHSLTVTPDFKRATLESQVHTLLRLIVHMILTHKAAVDDYSALKDKRLEEKIKNNEKESEEMARSVLELDDEDSDLHERDSD